MAWHEGLQVSVISGEFGEGVSEVPFHHWEGVCPQAAEMLPAAVSAALLLEVWKIKPVILMSVAAGRKNVGWGVLAMLEGGHRVRGFALTSVMCHLLYFLLFLFFLFFNLRD